MSLASQNIRTYVRDGYTDTKNSSAALPENEYLCNKDSKKSLQFFIPKEKTKTVPGKHLYHPHLLLHTLRIAIKPLRRIFLTISARHDHPPAPQESTFRTVEKPFPHHWKARIATPKRLFRNPANTVLQRKNTHTFDCQYLTQTAQNPRIRVRNALTTKISYSRGVAAG